MNTQSHSTTLWQDLRSLPGQYWILFGGTLVNRFGHFVLPFLVIYLRMRGYDGNAAAFTMACFGAGSLGAGIGGGYLTDRIGRKATMLISCGSSAACMLLLSQARGLPALSLTVFMIGLSSGMYGPAAGALIADLIPPHLRVRAFSCQRWAINVGFAAGMATAGFMAKKSFMALFVADAATTLILGLTLLIGITKRPRTTAAMTGWKPALDHMKGNVPFQRACMASFFMAVVFVQLTCTYSLQTTEGAGLGEQSYGLLMALNGVLIGCLELPLTSFTRRFAPVKIIAAGYVVLGCGMGINMLGASLAILVASMIVFTLGEMISMPVSNGYMASLAPDEMRGRYQGVMSFSWSGATMIGPPLGMMIYHFNPALLWICIMGLAFVSALLVLSAKRAGGIAKPQSPADEESQALACAEVCGD